MPVVIVESPAKAKTINKYLGKDFTVLASYGHVRDLPSKDGSVDPEKDFEMLWEVSDSSKKHVKAIVDALKSDNSLILATDPDREGEAISWHLVEELKRRKAINTKTPISRVVFNAITKSAVTEALLVPREIDQPLVDAYLARRALDYLVGYKLSPVLWRRLPGAKSAGRVQSVCLRLIVEREMEIERFIPKEYWTVKASLETPVGKEFEARLSELAENKIEKFTITNQMAAEVAVQAVESRELFVDEVTAKPTTRNPSAPFMTSTLQQEASRKFGFGAKQTMSAAQKLYESGLITYMRTDGIDIAPEAVMAARKAITAKYGERYLPKSPRMYKNKVKNAQEAHECIRPTDMFKSITDVTLTNSDQEKLYDLIYKRTLASQMAVAKFEQTTVEIKSNDNQVKLRANGQVILFDGFIKIYQEGIDEPDEEKTDSNLPQLIKGQKLEKKIVLPYQHFTQPPARYTEATLVKKMEELGIGRPSTYASVLTTIQDREYVRKEKNRLLPEDKGRLVTIFLENFFKKYVGYQFTANLEEELDNVSNGSRHYQEVLTNFWGSFSISISEALDLSITEVLEKINEVLEPHLFPKTIDGGDPRLCPHCESGRLSMRTARSGGAFIGCANYPECKYTRAFGPPGLENTEIGPEGKVLGEDSGDIISLRKGRYGPYVQRGEPTEDTPKPVRFSVPKGWDLSELNLEKALKLLALPRDIGPHPDDGEIIQTSIGRYGPYIKHNKIYANISNVDDVFDIGMNRAVEEIAKKVAGGKSFGSKSNEPIKDLGEHPDAGGKVLVMKGRYGPYIKWEKVNATIPKDIEPIDVTIEIAKKLLDAKATKKPTRKPKKRKVTKSKATK